MYDTVGLYLSKIFITVTNTTVLWIRNCQASDVTRALRASGQLANAAAGGRHANHFESMTSNRKIRFLHSMRIYSRNIAANVHRDLK